MSIATAIEDIRSRRRMHRINDREWAITSTDGTKHYVIHYDRAINRLTCTCVAGTSRVRVCWHRKRWLANHATVTTPSGGTHA